MMKGQVLGDTILLVGHGSRHQKGNRKIEKFADKWRERNPSWNIELCFIELAEPLLDQGLERAAKNADRIIVVPLILSAAGHVREDIPEAIEKAQANYPNTKFIYSEAIGTGDPVLAILKRRLDSAMTHLDMPDPRNTGVILLARGSSDRKANGEIAKMARYLYEESDHELVDIAFTGITHPRLETIAQRQDGLGMMQIVILPFYLFTGTLLYRIKRQTEHLEQQYQDVRFALGNPIGLEEEIFALLDERVKNAIKRDMS